MGFLLALFTVSCNKEESPSSSSSPSKQANCVFTKHEVQVTVSGVIGSPEKYTINHYTTVKNAGNATANDVKIVIYLKGSSYGSINVIGSLASGSSVNKDFQTITTGDKPELKLWWQ